jgi:MFS family permease
VKTVVVTRNVDATELAALRQPKAAPTLERANGDDTFALEDGPFDHYLRTLDVPADPDADGTFEVVETTEFKVSMPVWGVLFTPLFAGIIKRPPDPDKPLWFLPPDHMSRRATEVLSLLCVFSVITGYLGVLLSQTNAFFQKDFGVSNTEISDVQIAVRIGAFLAFLVVAVADRRGRRKILLAATVIGILLAATGAFAPSLFWLGISQGFARAFSAAIGILILIIASEEMPAGARAFAVSVLAMTAALGAGGVVLFLWVADLAPGAWRIFYLTPLLFLFTLRPLARRLPESKRFEVFELSDESTIPPSGAAEAHDRRAERLRRFASLGAVNLFYNLFLAPANGFQNNFLRNEQGFSGGQIALFQVITTVPPGIMLVVGGRLADKYGRRLTGTIGVIGNTIFTVAMYLSSGWMIWMFSALSVFFGVLVIPALGVYQSEMFATGSRGRASGAINLLAVGGAVVGLRAVGVLADRYGSFGPAVAIVGLAPVIVAAVVLLFYPETAHKELEELNPEDRPPPEDPDDLEKLDELYETTHDGRAAPTGDADVA